MNDQLNETDSTFLAIGQMLAPYKGVLDDAMKLSIARHAAAFAKIRALEQALQEIELFKEFYGWDTDALLKNARAALQSSRKIWEQSNADPNDIDDVLRLVAVINFAHQGLGAVEKARELTAQRLRRKSYQLAHIQVILQHRILYFVAGILVAIPTAVFSPHAITAMFSLLLMALVVLAGLTLGHALKAWNHRQPNKRSSHIS